MYGYDFQRKCPDSLVVPLQFRLVQISRDPQSNQTLGNLLNPVLLTFTTKDLTMEDKWSGTFLFYVCTRNSKLNIFTIDHSLEGKSTRQGSL